MPIYEYQCDACGHKLEKLQKIAEAPLRDCPECDDPHLRKLISAAAFRLKGGGWYETDFKEEKAQKNLAKGEDKPKEANDKTDDKPAQKEPQKDNKGSNSGNDSATSSQAKRSEDSPAAKPATNTQD